MFPKLVTSKNVHIQISGPHLKILSQQAQDGDWVPLHKKIGFSGSQSHGKHHDTPLVP
jgi:hypothetical protein